MRGIRNSNGGGAKCSKSRESGLGGSSDGIRRERVLIRGMSTELDEENEVRMRALSVYQLSRCAMYWDRRIGRRDEVDSSWNHACSSRFQREVHTRNDVGTT